ncbi:MAG: PQQ-like beta-propeller repeat protein [Chthonomonadaceae bacterium]|nr:PQQ-like beta-propeller repeat protein [Chthonomonadaceae bacterium]
MIKRNLTLIFPLSAMLLPCLSPVMAQRKQTPTAGNGSFDWRGLASQDGDLSSQTRSHGTPDKISLDSKGLKWSIPLQGGGTPVLANGNLYTLTYGGQGADLQEALTCLDAKTGKMRWEHRFNDYLSDIVYDRYAIGSPTIDPETGNVYTMTSAGVFACFTANGKPLWEHAMMEELGRLTFTNGRTGAPVVFRDRVIVRGITSNWGAEGAAMDRLYAFDKKTGVLIWSCSPGAAPKDNSFARPYFDTDAKGRSVLYTGAGDGSVICVNAMTGETLWRLPISAGGCNASVIRYKNSVVAIHADENLDSSEIGRMVALNVNSPTKPVEGSPIPQLDPASAEVWRNELSAISSSPVLVGNRIYQCNKTGNFCCVDADTGKVLWKYKLGPDQLHASPTYADGKFYVPIQNGNFFVLTATDEGAKELSHVQLAGRCLGAPNVDANGNVYVLTTERLYCFAGGAKQSGSASAPVPSTPTHGATVSLQILPSEVSLIPGEKVKMTVRGIDANGYPTETFDPKTVTWARYVPPTARVKSELNGTFDASGQLTASDSLTPSAGAFQATVGNLKGTMRGRIMPDLPLTEDFEKFTPTEPDLTEPNAKFSYPPLPWIGARFKFDVRELNGNKVLAKTLDNVFFQRATVFFGHPEAKNYTFDADVMTDGNRRTLSTVGVINQRYLIILNGNAQELEVSSNQERIKATVPFKIEPMVWYHLKTQVDVAKDGSGVVHAKVWKKDGVEPSDWTISVPHKHAHLNGSPGLFGFAPQSQFKVYIDNISVQPRKN